MVDVGSLIVRSSEIPERCTAANGDAWDELHLGLLVGRDGAEERFQAGEVAGYC